MFGTRNLMIGLVVVVLVAAAAGCGGGSKHTGGSTTGGGGGAPGSSNGTYGNGSAARGGVYRTGWEQSFGFKDNFDPTGEYLGQAWGIYTNLLLRTLIGYKHQPGAAGNQLVGDLATSVPQPTAKGLTYTYHLRKGIKFGPPVNRAITSKDVAYALQRLASPKDGGEYAFYFSVVKGWDAYAAGKATAISGIQ